MKQGLLLMLEELKEAQNDCFFDLQQDWCKEHKALMELQLGLLSDVIARLELLASKPDSQFFKSSMSL